MLHVWQQVVLCNGIVVLKSMAAHDDSRTHGLVLCFSVAYCTPFVYDANMRASSLCRLVKRQLCIYLLICLFIILIIIVIIVIIIIIVAIIIIVIIINIFINIFIIITIIIFCVLEARLQW